MMRVGISDMLRMATVCSGIGAPEAAAAGLGDVGDAVRRLTPTECERLMGFPEGYTAIPWRGRPAEECPDGPRYMALGNSMAVPVVRWILKRIVEEKDGSNS